MARKNLLKDLIDKAAEPPGAGSPEAQTDAARPRYSGGAIGAVSQSIAHLKSRAIVDIDPDKVHGAGLEDRLDGESDADHAALVASIRDHGQQVPILVRPHPEQEDAFQVVYGRRRVLALRELGVPVKALVRDLDDRSLVIAQGQENSARKDLSFIEKAHFARQMRDMGYDRAVICAALHVDKTVVSRMLSVIDRLPGDLVKVIGAAPSVGRDRWMALAELIERNAVSANEAMATVNLASGADTSDKRFVALMGALQAWSTSKKEAADTARANPEARSLKTASGASLGSFTRKGNRTVLTFAADDARGFEDWLIENIAEIHRGWKSSLGE